MCLLIGLKYYISFFAHKFLQRLLLKLYVLTTASQFVSSSISSKCFIEVKLRNHVVNRCEYTGVLPRKNFELLLD